MLEKDLLIVGAGPAGLTLAAALLPSIPATIISEAPTGRGPHSRATGIQPRTFEIMRSVGILDAVRSEALTLLGNKIYVDGSQRFAVSFFDPISREHGLSLDQHRIEELLEARAHTLGRRIEYGTTLVDLEEQGERVVTEVQKQDGSTELWSCRYVVGCDGGRSAVRKASGIAFTGETYDERSFVLDGLVRGDLEPGYMHFFVTKESRLVIVPLNERGLCKVSGAFPADTEVDDRTLLQQLVAEHGRGNFSVEPLTPITTYVMHGRIAENFQRHDRIFLCGDAAHLFPPNGGQGMNVALEDAYELAHAFNNFAQHNSLLGFRRYAQRHQVVQEKLSAVMASRERYSYRGLLSDLCPSEEQARVEQEEL
jgi:2-polyprenyl-6-methoxyphenol hydroxylase-like FAD-dependent oxidoreductase